MLVLLAVVHGSTEAVIHDLSSTTAESGLSTVTGEPNRPAQPNNSHLSATDAPAATAKPAVSATVNATHSKNSTITGEPYPPTQPE